MPLQAENHHAAQYQANAQILENNVLYFDAKLINRPDLSY